MQNNCIDGALYAVILVVFCHKTKRFLFLKELTEKPKVFKKKGMLALPSETKSEVDTSVRATVERLVHEEVGVLFDTDTNFQLFLPPLEVFPHDIPVYVASVAVEDEFEAQPQDIDIEHAMWLTEESIQELDTISDFFRIETVTVLEVFKKESALT